MKIVKSRLCRLNDQCDSPGPKQTRIAEVESCAALLSSNGGNISGLFPARLLADAIQDLTLILIVVPVECTIPLIIINIEQLTPISKSFLISIYFKI